jgi:serine O-acetyltransferase
MPFHEPIHDIVKAILDSYADVGGINHLEGNNLPSMEAVETLLRDLQSLVLPGFYETLQAVDPKELPYATAEHVFRVAKGLISEIDKALTFGNQPGDCHTAEAPVFQLLHDIPAIRKAMKDDVAAMLEGDPAARSAEEIILAYPGVEAILVHRIAHVLYQKGVPLIPRMMSEIIHRKTGIDIHPGATIGKRFYIDHGTGIVIGETAVVGDDVSMLHGVTLGGTGAERGDRHPKIGRGVLLGAGAKVLGNITIGDYAKVASGSVVLKPVPPHCTAAGVPARIVNCPTCEEPARTMDQTLAEAVYDYVI